MKVAGKDYNWKRFWCPRDKGFSLADGGYLYDPDSEYGRVVNPNLVAYEGLVSTSCLILLGEPGIGKSFELNKFYSAASSRFASSDEVLLCDLRSYGEESRLCSEIFQSAEFDRWMHGTHHLHLFLDSLDECLLRMETVTALFEEKLSRYQIERLVLRIACRTAEWPHSFEEPLKKLYGKEKVRAYELVPLLRVDVLEAARCEDVAEPEKFLDCVADRNAVPLAIKPVTLRLLINLFKEDMDLPSRQNDLYEKGCSLMCEEPSERRREAGAKKKYQSLHLLAAASRIAAAAVFGNRYAVWIDIDEGNVPQEDVTISELAGGSEKVEGDNVQVTNELIEAAIGTGLFTSRGPRRMSWAHQTYAEFLAARYVLQASMSGKQIMNLLTNAVGDERKVVPQLCEVGAWIANGSADVFNSIMECDPEVLLRSDVASFEADHRGRLVERLLGLFEQERLEDRDIYQYYRKLRHQGLASQLRPYIQEKGKGWLVRRVAVKIAEACEVTELLPELVSVALDPTETCSDRVNAACAVAHIGDRESKGKLRPLVFGQGGDDPEDELKGCGLMACWPDHLTAEELFTVLCPPRRPSFFGWYSSFLYELPERLRKTLSVEDCKYGLEWIVRSTRYCGYESLCEKIQESIMLLGWEHLLESQTLVELFATAAICRLSQAKPIANGSKEHPFAEVIRGDHYKRRLVLGAMLSSEGAVYKKIGGLVFVRTPVAIDEDIPWLVEQCEKQNHEWRTRAAKLVGWLFTSNEYRYLDEVLWARDKYPEFAEELSWTYPVEIDSPKRRKLKAEHLRRVRWEKRMSQPLLNPPPRERVLALLERFEGGEPNAWWWLNREMTLEPNSRTYGDEFQSDLTKLPGWTEADEQTRNRIVSAAQRYILHPPELDTSWIGTNTMYFPYMAGYRALVLLMNKCPEWVARLTEDVWKTWAPIVVGYPLSCVSEEEPHESIRKMAYQNAPDDVFKYLLVIIDKENRDHSYVFVIRRFENCLDDRLCKALFKKMQCGDMKAGSVGDLADILMEHGHAAAVKYAKSELSKAIPEGEVDRERLVVLAESLVAHDAAGGWDVVWPVIEGDPKFGREVFEKYAHFSRRNTADSLGRRLGEAQVASLYVWLAKQYPHKEDPQHEDAHAVGDREMVARFRDELLGHLKTRGTLESLSEMRRIATELPDLGWLKWTIMDAERETRAKTWRPLSPKQIIGLAQDSQRMFVQDGGQLLEAICESLDRLGRTLHDELPAVRNLWDNRGNSRKAAWYPKDEEHLSGYVARHLKEDLGKAKGIVVNREVQIRRGQKTDIHVDAINPEAKGSVDVVSAIIEVKGCWHHELDVATKSQLVGRYLKENQCPNGLYLVGWFLCDKWSEEDDRRKKCPKYSFEEAMYQFSRQTREVGSKCKREIPGLELRSYVLDARLR